MTRIYSDAEMGGLRELLEAEVLQWPGVAVKKLFGCPGYRRGGDLFAFLRDGFVVVRNLPEVQREAFAKKLNGGPFTYPSPKGGMVMAGWLQLPYADDGDLEKVLPAVRAAHDVARATPPRPTQWGQTAKKAKTTSKKASRTK
ncbi:MAG TPA: hypothetical protein VM286_05635 [Candidatus Thermoplasmatota archaeon]|nr:hypothetical protein [Candidatus Thermoplasmatota archaeon]